MEYRLRPASDSDCEFLYVLHQATMRAVIEATWGWDEAWQQTDFERRRTEYMVSIIEVASRRVGSLWLEWKEDSLYIHEIQIAPDFQGKGIGTAVIQDVIDEAPAAICRHTLRRASQSARQATV